MIHVATVHFNDDRWIPIQTHHLRRCITSPFRIHACLDGIDERHHAAFDHVTTDPGQPHAAKLNRLADDIVAEAEHADDLLVFIDGDAFPIAPIEPFIRRTLPDHPLIAIQRLENNGDRQPHPSFCVTTVGFWKSIEGDWRGGYRWRNACGKRVSDVGGNLLGLLEERGIDWYPLTRSNTHDLHPIWFGVYGGLVYHHGAGFRDPISRFDRLHHDEAGKKQRRLSRLIERLPENGALRRRLERLHPVQRMRRRIIRRNQRLFAEVQAMIDSDGEFYRVFMGGGRHGGTRPLKH